MFSGFPNCLLILFNRNLICYQNEIDFRCSTTGHDLQQINCLLFFNFFFCLDKNDMLMVACWTYTSKDQDNSNEQKLRKGKASKQMLFWLLLFIVIKHLFCLFFSDNVVIILIQSNSVQSGHRIHAELPWNRPPYFPMKIHKKKHHIDDDKN